MQLPLLLLLLALLLIISTDASPTGGISIDFTERYEQFKQHKALNPPNRFYHLLNVEPTATQEEIKKSFRHLAMQYHPDKLQSSVSTTNREHAKEIFQEINVASRVLLDEAERRRYDDAQTRRLGTATATGTRSSSSPLGTKEFFRQAREEGVIKMRNSGYINEQTSLAIICNLDEYTAYNQVAGSEVPIDSDLDTLLENSQLGKFRVAGMPPSLWMDSIGQVFEMYQIPFGLATKLMALQQFDLIEFVIDDSDYMNSGSGFSNGAATEMSRWLAVGERLKMFCHVLAFIPLRKLRISFASKLETLEYSRVNSAQSPAEFIKEISSKIDALFQHSPPRGTAPLLQKIINSLATNDPQITRVMRYLIFEAKERRLDRGPMEQILRYRTNPHNKPISIIDAFSNPSTGGSAIDTTSQWISDMSDSITHCAAFHGYTQEARKVLNKQGLAFPFTKGFSLVSQLVAVLHRLEFQALYDYIPLTKKQLVAFLGIEYSKSEYRYYFKHLTQIQQRLPFDWGLHFEEFLTSTTAGNILAVTHYLEKKQGSSLRGIGLTSPDSSSVPPSSMGSNGFGRGSGGGQAGFNSFYAGGIPMPQSQYAGASGIPPNGNPGGPVMPNDEQRLRREAALRRAASDLRRIFNRNSVN